MLSAALWGNGAIESYDYNDRLQVTVQSLVKDNVTVQRYQYAYGQVNATTGTVDETKNNGQLGCIESFIGTQQQWQQRYQYAYGQVNKEHTSLFLMMSNREVVTFATKRNNQLNEIVIDLSSNSPR